MAMCIFLLILIPQVFTADYISNCFEYDGDSCVKCEGSYGIDTDKNSETYGLCIKCKIFKCSNCGTNAYNCEECYYPYVFDTDSSSKTYNKCVSCPRFCMSCASSELGQCDSCELYYKLNSRKECVLSPNSKLQNCDLDDNGICYLCKRGYTIDNEGKCIPCNNKGCLNCISSPDFCVECIKDIYIYNTTTIKCDECSSIIPNCKKCDEEGCNECDEGYYLYKNECLTKACIENCELCKNDTSCSKCKSGYGLNSTGSCVPCDDKHCSDCRDKYTSCYSCEMGYSMHFDGCMPYDSPHCTNNWLTICEQCEDGYALDVTTTERTCVKSFIPNCEQYVGEKCYWCVYPYSLDLDANECKLECKEHCTCGRRTTCDNCIDGYKLVETNCEPLREDGCGLLDYDGVCKGCVEGHYYNPIDQKCYKCSSENCINCKDGPDFCYECKVGSGLDLSRGSPNYGKCHSCTVKNCKYCDNYADQCTECEYGYTLIRNKCINGLDDDNNNDDNDNDNDNGNNNGNDDGNDKDDDNDNSSGNGDNKDKLPTGAIIGIVVGCIIVIGVVVFLLVFFLVIKKKNADHSTSEVQE